MIGAAFFFGWAVTLLLVPRLADNYGRKPVFAYGITFSALLYTILMFTDSLNVTIFVSLLFGMMTSVRLNIGIIYLLELIPPSYCPTVTALRLTVEGSIYVMAAIYFWKISTNWFYFVLIGYILQLISAFFIW